MDQVSRCHLAPGDLVGSSCAPDRGSQYRSPLSSIGPTANASPAPGPGLRSGRFARDRSAL